MSSPTVSPTPTHATRATTDLLFAVARAIDTQLTPGTMPPPPAVPGSPPDDLPHPTVEGVATVDDGPHIVGGVLGERTAELVARPATGHPADDLLGFTAPADWDLLGIVSGAWASWHEPLDHGVPRACGIDRRRVRVVYLLHRGGQAVQILHDRGTRLEHAVHRDAPEAGGALDDACRRAFGLPTAPAPATTLEYFTLRWIDRVFAGAADGALAHASWADIAVLHDAARQADAHRDPALTAWVVEHLVRAGVLLAQAQPWEQLHRAAAAGPRTDAFDPALASWMDAGMFARSALAALPPIEHLLLDLTGLLPRPAHERLLQVVDAWGVLDGAAGVAPPPDPSTDADATRDCPP